MALVEISDNIVVQVYPDGVSFHPDYMAVLQSQPDGVIQGDYIDPVTGNNAGQQPDDTHSIDASGNWVIDPVLVEQQQQFNNSSNAPDYVQQITGRFLLDPNEVNGFGQGGWVDETIARDMGNADAVSLSRLSGGYIFPFDIKLDKFRVWHRNSNAAAEAWGWVIAKQSKSDNSNTVTTTYILHETQSNGGIGNRNYLSTSNQFTDLDLSSLSDNKLLAGEVLFVGVASPTAATTNYYVECMAGMISMNFA